MLAASLAGDGGTIAVRIRNISEFGALLEGYPLPPRGQKVMLRRVSLGASARIAWSRGTSCGVEFDQPIVPAKWLDPTARPLPPTGQARVDAIQAAIRAGSSIAAFEQPSRKESRGRPDDQTLEGRIAEEMEHVQRILEVLGEALATDPLVLNRHSAALQQVDLASQLLGQLAKVVGAEDKDAAVAAVAMTELRARLTRRRL